MNEPRPWRPTRRRTTETLRAALAPVAACGVALAALTAWAGTGNAGSPARITVASGRVLLPYGTTAETAAFFDVTNTGGADDRLVKVTSSAVSGGITFSRHLMMKGSAAYRTDVDSADVPAGGRLTLSPDGVDLTLRAGAGWRAGDRVPFTLYFEHSAPVRTTAVVVRPGADTPL